MASTAVLTDFVPVSMITGAVRLSARMVWRIESPSVPGRITSSRIRWGASLRNSSRPSWASPAWIVSYVGSKTAFKEVLTRASSSISSIRFFILVSIGYWRLYRERRQAHEKRGADTDRALHQDFAVILFNYFMDHRHPKSCPLVFSTFMFCREEWVEDVFEIRILDSFTGVLDLNVGPHFPFRLQQLAGLNA